MRKIHSKEFKFKVALEALRGDLTISQIVSRYQVSTSLIHKWKKQVLSDGSKLFDRGTSAVTPFQDTEKLHAKIGQLTLERDFLESALLKSR